MSTDLRAEEYAGMPCFQDGEFDVALMRLLSTVAHHHAVIMHAMLHDGTLFEA